MTSDSESGIAALLTCATRSFADSSVHVTPPQQVKASVLALSYWLPCRHVIYAFETLGEIEEPDWEGLAEQFDELGFEIYQSVAL
jgi:hypothetical protein